MAKTYESEITKFIRDLKQKNPRLEEEQRAARARWWDRKLDLEEQRRFAQARVPQKPYVYQTSLK